jgi:hypothetical protein
MVEWRVTINEVLLDWLDIDLALDDIYMVYQPALSEPGGRFTRLVNEVPAHVEQQDALLQIIRRLSLGIRNV